MPTYARAPLTFVKGEGSWLIDENSEKYLDMGAGIAVNVLGHAHPDLVQVLQNQAENLWHTSNLYNVSNQKKLADVLVEETFAQTVFFTNSGTESMECAIKMARKFHYEKGMPERTKIITFEGSFHGRSIGMISAAGSEKLTKGFGPLLPGFVQIPFGDHEALIAEIDETIAAIVIEPIQGEGGILPVPDQCLKGLRDCCDENGILLIFDEVITGFRFANGGAQELFGVTPDLSCFGKGIANGFPISVIAGKREIMEGFKEVFFSGTFGGELLSLTAANVDDQDLYIEELNPDNPEEYRTPTGFKPFETRSSIIMIKDAEPVTLTLRWTDNGPVLPGSHYDLASVTPPGHVVSLAWTALNPRDTSMAAALNLVAEGNMENAQG